MSEDIATIVARTGSHSAAAAELGIGKGAVEYRLRQRPAGRKAWCPVCRVVEMVDGKWRCVWCECVTLAARAKPGRPHPGSISVSTLRAAHRLHAEGATLLEAAEAVWPETGYISPRILAQRLPMAFAGIGLPYRSIAAAQKKRCERDPHLFRPDITRSMAEAAVRQHSSLERAAQHLGCSRRTVARRLKAIRTAGL